jgi:hypothetical protein
MDPSIQAEVGSIRGANDAAADSHAREWWERYLLLLIPLLLVSFYVVYIWPSYIDLWPLFITWMVLVGAVFWFVAVRVDKVLKSPEYRLVTLKPDGNPVTTQNRRFAGAMIKAAAIMAGYAAINSFVYVVTRNYESTGWFIFLPLIASLVFLLLFLLVWPGRAPGLEGWLDTYPGFWLTVLVIAVVLLGSAAATWRLPTQIVQGPPASWPDLLRFAQREAENKDGNAVLERISAGPDYRADPPFSPQSTPFLVEFEFVRPNASSIRVKVFDTDPPRLQGVEDTHRLPLENGATLSPDILSGYAEKISNVALSPRDAYHITEQEGLAFAQQVAPGQPPDITMLLMNLDNDWQECFGTPAEWTLMYSVEGGGEHRAVLLRVDGASGEIVGREYLPEVPGAKPPPILGPCS